VTICLQPGRYKLREPILMGPDQSGVTIEACGEGVVIEVADGAESAFVDGLVVATNTHDITLRGLRFRLPHIAAGQTGFSVGVRPYQCSGISVTECVFTFDDTREGPLFAAGIFAGGHCRGLDVRDCTFRAHGAEARPRAQRSFFGYVHAPSLRDDSKLTDAALTGAMLRQNVFSGLTAGMLTFAHLGEIHLEGNRLQSGDGGFWLFDAGSSRQPPKEVAEMFHEEIVWRGLLQAYRQPIPSGVTLEESATEVILRLHVADNTIDAAHEPSGSALLVWAAGAAFGGSAIVSANRMSNSSCKAPTTFLGRLYIASVTGNVIVNHGAEQREARRSLHIVDDDDPHLYSFTGNVMAGKDNVPVRWAPMNECGS
jgi:hypothetical protein